MYFFRTSTHPYCPVYYKHHHSLTLTLITTLILRTHITINTCSQTHIYTHTHLHLFNQFVVLLHETKNPMIFVHANNKLTIVDTTR